MKRWLTMLLALCLCTAVAAAETAAPKLSYEPEELDMPAVFLRISVPADLQRLEGDEEAFDLGLRYSGYSQDDTFSLYVSVNDSRDMNLADYAAFYAARYGYAKVEEERINGFYAMRLTDSQQPGDFAILLAAPDDEAPAAVYDLVFTCDGEQAEALAEEILSTLALYGM